MAETIEACPKCCAEAVVFDDIQGLKVCEACGVVIEETELVQYVTGYGDEGPSGVFVSAADSGRAAGAYLLPGSGVGLSIQRSSRHQAQAKLKARVREVGNQLHLQSAVVDQALHFQEQLLPTLMGNWRRDQIVAAAVYAACRTNKLPLSLVDLSGVMHADIFTLGRHYQAALKLLGVKPPPLEPEILLARGLDRVAAVLRDTGRLPREGSEGSGSLRRLQPDAIMLLRWMGAQCEGLHHPTANVGAAVVLAAEMNSVVGVGSEAASVALSVARPTIDRKLLQVRRKLLDLSHMLPYHANISMKNVGSHARTLVKLSGVLLVAGGASSAAVTDPAQQAEHAKPNTGAQPPVKPSVVAAHHLQQGAESRARDPAQGAEQPAAKRRAEGGEIENAPSKQQRLEVCDAREAAAAAEAGADGGESGQGDVWEKTEEDKEESDDFDAELEQYLRPPHEVEMMRAVMKERVSGKSKDEG